MRSSAGMSSSPGSTTGSRSGTERPGVASWQRSKGVRRMLPNALQPSATDHVPVLADEVRRLLAVRPGETVVDATFGAGGHAALLAADLAGRGKLIAIDRAERGFSYAVDAPLDMRMDTAADVTAAGIVNEADERRLATIFKRYGEERYARQIAKAIVRRRKE